jgi:hypothetical protein
MLGKWMQISPLGSGSRPKTPIVEPEDVLVVQPDERVVVGFVSTM